MNDESLLKPIGDEDKPKGFPMDADEFVRSLGFSDAEIAASEARVRQRYPQFFVDQFE